MNMHLTTGSRSRRVWLASVLVSLALFGAACGGSEDEQAAPTAVPEPTATEVPPTAIPEPTATEVPPTAVPEPTATEVPPTAVPEPTATEVPPTAEPEPTVEVADEGTDEPAATSGSDSEGALPDPEETEEAAAVVPVVDGGAIYQANCSGCHGPAGEGGTSKAIAGIGPLLADNSGVLVDLITNGGTNMPSFGAKLSAEEIDAVTAWVIANL